MNTYKTHFRVVHCADVVLTVEAENINDAKALVDIDDLACSFDRLENEAISSDIHWYGYTESPDGFEESPSIEAIHNMVPEADFRF